MSGTASCGGRFISGPCSCVPLRDLDLAADEIDAGDHFGDGVLHLDARVHLDEEPLSGVGIDEKLDGAGVVVAGGLSRAARRRRRARCGPSDRDRRPARLRRPSGGGAARSNRARRGGRCCRGGRRGSALRCAWRGECTSRGTPRRCQRRAPASRRASSSSACEIAGLVDDAHAASAAAEGRLDDQRKADSLRDLRAASAGR